jgi:putative heme-binding domain-containing protein
MRAGVEGHRDVQAPASWNRVYSALQADTVAGPLAREVAQFFGDAEAARHNLAILRDRAAPVEQRRIALATLARQQREEIASDLPSLIADGPLRVEAIRAVAAFDRRALGELLLASYSDFSASERQEVIESLASRPTYGRLLTDALRSGAIQRRDVPANVARQLRRVVGVGFVEVWGPIDLDTGEEQAAYAKYRALLTTQALARADASDGRAVYQRSCGACHVLYGEGGDVGPELTGTNRGNVHYLLSNIINPSEVIQDDYRLVVITTRGGRTYMGNVIGETDRQITLRLVGQNPVTLAKSDILAREVSSASLMPDGLLRTLTDTEVLNLFAYLRSAEQVPLPAPSVR